MAFFVEISVFLGRRKKMWTAWAHYNSSCCICSHLSWKICCITWPPLGDPLFACDVTVEAVCFIFTAERLSSVLHCAGGLQRNIWNTPYLDWPPRYYLFVFFYKFVIDRQTLCLYFS